MARRLARITGAAASLVGGAAAPAPSAADAARRPDLVVFLADDLGVADTGPYGGRDIATPRIDRLAADGLTFDRAFVASPACAPSRGALLTGLMPARNGAVANHDAPRTDVAKLPAYLHALGYQVVAFGKVAHYEQVRDDGFDHWEHAGFHDDAGVDAAVRWLNERRDPRPLALFVGSNWPHVPWPGTTEGIDPARVTLPARSVDTPITRNARARYLAAVARLDGEVGRLVAASDRVLGPDAFVLFSSDHGAQWPFGKWNLYDTGIRTPLIVRWRGSVAAGRRTGAMVSWVDILPTLVDIAGGRAPSTLDGRSFASVLRGRTTRARDAIFTTHNNDRAVNVYPMRSVRTERFHYIVNLHPDWTYTTHIDQFVARVDSGVYFPSWRAAAERDPRARAIIDAYYRRPVEELYDVVADPDETHNLAGDARHAGTLRTLRARLAAWRRAQGDTGTVPVPSHLSRGPIEGAPAAD